MQLDEIDKLIEALVIATGGWRGEAGGASHKFYMAAHEVVERKRKELEQRSGICLNCGCKNG